MASSSSVLESMIDIYRDLAKIPSGVGGGHIEVKEDCVLVTTVWNHRDLTRNQPVKFLQSYLLHDIHEKKKKVSVACGPAEIYEACRVYTHSDSKIAVFRKVVPGKKSGGVKIPDEAEFMEVFDCESSYKDCTVNLTAAEKHGAIHVNDEIGGIEWSSGEGHLLYVAEKFKKDIGYYDPKFDPSDEENLEKTNPGEGFEFQQSWGEQLEKVKNPTLCILDVPSGAVSVLENLPEGITPVQVRISAIVYPVSDASEIRSALFHYSLAEASCTKFGNEGVSQSSIRFAPNNSAFVFVERPAGGTHFGGCKLMREVIVVDTENGTCTKITNVGDSVHGSWSVLDVKGIILKLHDTFSQASNKSDGPKDDWVLVSCSAPNRAPCVLIGQLPPAGKEELIVWVRLNNEKAFDALTANIKWSILGFRRGRMDEKDNYVDAQYEGILIQPSDAGCKGDSKKKPLIVCPHGGPHSVSVTSWVLAPAFFASMGYAVLRLNYRGSIGFGEEFLHSLPGKVGSSDVRDCQHAVETVITADFGIDEKKICLFGGSHGGFLSAHLAGQYPDFYKACVAFNPVLNMATLTGVTDICDWVSIEGLGIEFEAGHVFTPEEYKQMWLKSPIRYVEQIKCPVLFLIGGSDARVPPSQRNEFWRILKSRNVPCKVLYYPENNHPIAKIDAECDWTINTIRWMEECLNKFD